MTPNIFLSIYSLFTHSTKIPYTFLHSLPKSFKLGGKNPRKTYPDFTTVAKYTQILMESLNAYCKKYIFFYIAILFVAAE